MKPRARPGKVTVGAKSKSKGKLLSREEMAHLRGGKKAKWDIDYEEGIKYAKAKMPGEKASDSIRRIPKKGSGR